MLRFFCGFFETVRSKTERNATKIAVEMLNIEARINNKSAGFNHYLIENQHFRCLSGWRDSNSRPPAPKAGALTGLRYTPCRCEPYHSIAVQSYELFFTLQEFLCKKLHFVSVYIA